MCAVFIIDVCCVYSKYTYVNSSLYFYFFPEINPWTKLDWTAHTTPDTLIYLLLQWDAGGKAEMGI